MAAFADVDTLASFLQRTLTTAEEATAALLLDMASDAIRQDVGQAVDEVTGDTVTLPGTYAGTLLLPETPVTAVASVTVDDVPLVADTDYTWTKAGVLTRAAGWSWYGAKIDVTYSHGWPTDSRQYAACRLVCIQAAARAFVNPGQVQQEALGGASVGYAVTTATGRIELNDYERSLLDGLRV